MAQGMENPAEYILFRHALDDFSALWRERMPRIEPTIGAKFAEPVTSNLIQLP
jgi:hypothetical protein